MIFSRVWAIKIELKSKKIEVGGEQADYTSRTGQAWLPLEASSAQELNQTRAPANEEGICGEALKPQTCLVGRKRAPRI